MSPLQTAVETLRIHEQGLVEGITAIEQSFARPPGMANEFVTVAVNGPCGVRSKLFYQRPGDQCGYEYVDDNRLQLGRPDPHQ